MKRSRPRFLVAVAAVLTTVALLFGVTSAVGASFPKSPPSGPWQVDKTGTSITIGWGSVSTANLYYVRYATNASMTANKKVVSSKTTERNVTGLKPNTWYYFQVRAAKGTTSNHTLLSDYSTPVVKILTPSYTFSPPGSFRADYSLKDAVGLSWNFVNNADSYRIEISSQGQATRYIRVQDTSTLRRISHEVTGLTPGRSYSFRIRALEQTVDPTTGDYYELTGWSGTVTRSTSSTSAGTDVTERPPSEPTLTTIAANKIGLTWDPVSGSDATGYRLQYTYGGNTYYHSMPSHASSVTLTGSIPNDNGAAVTIAKNRAFTFRVAALRTGGSDGTRISDYSSALAVTPKYDKEPAANLHVTHTTGEAVSLAWDKVDTATQYRVDWTRSANPTGACEEKDNSCRVITPTNLNAPSYTVTDLNPGVTYYFRVSAVNGSTISDFQPIMVSATTVADAPQMVKQVPNSPASTTTITVEWSASTAPSIASYQLRWSTDQAMKNSTSINVGNVLTRRITGLTKEKLHFVQVRGRYSDGSYTGWSAITAVYTRPYRGSITGKVNDLAGTDSSAETIVYAYQASSNDVGGVARPAADGTFTIWDLPPGTWRLHYAYFGDDEVTSPWYRSSGTLPFYKSQGTSVSTNNDNVDISAVTPVAGVSIRGSVTSQLCRSGTRVSALSDNSSVSGAKDTVLGDTRTAANGSYVIHGLPKNEAYWIRFTGSNCGSKSVHVPASQTGSSVTGINTSFQASGNGVVEGLKATNVTASNATISWAAYPDAVNYRVAWWPTTPMPSECGPRCHTTGSSSTSISLSQILSGNASGGNATPKAGETYYIRVSAINAAGKTITTWQSSPLAVSLSSQLVNIKPATNVTGTDATLNWDAFPGAAQYRVYWSTSSSMPSACEPTCQLYSLAEVGGGSSPSISLKDVVGNVRQGGVYYIKISAVDAGGHLVSSGWQSAPTQVDLTGGAVSLPSTVSGIHEVSSGSSGVKIGWNPVPTATKYRVYYTPTSSMPSACGNYCEVIVPADRAEPTFTIASASRKYVKVSAITTENGKDRTITGWQSSPFVIGDSGAGSSSGGAGGAGDVQGLGTVGTIGATDATLTWDAYPGAAKYRIYWSTAESMPSACEPTCQLYALSELDGTSPPRISLAEVIGNVLTGGTYFFKVSATDAGNTLVSTGGWQSTPLAVNLSGPTASVPGTVQHIAGTPAGGGIKVTWDAVPTASQYRVYYSPTSSMPSKCEPYCEVIVPADRANPSFTIPASQVSRTYVKISAIRTENGKDKTITGWQPVATNVAS